MWLVLSWQYFGILLFQKEVTKLEEWISNTLCYWCEFVEGSWSDIVRPECLWACSTCQFSMSNVTTPSLDPLLIHFSPGHVTTLHLHNIICNRIFPSAHKFFLDIVTPEDGTGMLSLSVGNKLPTGTVQHPRSQEFMTNFCRSLNHTVLTLAPPGSCRGESKSLCKMYCKHLPEMVNEDGWHCTEFVHSSRAVLTFLMFSGVQMVPSPETFTIGPNLFPQTSLSIFYGMNWWYSIIAVFLNAY